MKSNQDRVKDATLSNKTMENPEENPKTTSYVFSPKQNIWIIPLVTTIVNLLAYWRLGIKNEWFIFGIYIAGFLLIAWLAWIYYKDQVVKGKISFLKEMVWKKEILNDGTVKEECRIDSNTANVIEKLKL